MAKKAVHHIAALGLAFSGVSAHVQADDKTDPIRLRSTELSTAVPGLAAGFSIVRPTPVTLFEVASGVVDRAENLQQVLKSDPRFAFSEAQRNKYTDHLTRAIQLQMRPGVSCVSMTTAIATTPGNTETMVQDHTAFGLQPGLPFVYQPKLRPRREWNLDARHPIFQDPLPAPEELNLPIYPADMSTQASDAIKKHNSNIMVIFAPGKSAEACSSAGLKPFSYEI